MKDNKTMAYINMYAIFGALEVLCRVDEEAKQLASPAKPMSICWEVSGGPACVMTFDGGKCTVVPEKGPAKILIKVGSCDKFNAIVDGTASPFPIWGLWNVKFLLENFAPMTKILEKYLRATPEQLAADAVLFEKSTTIMMYVVAGAIVALGNNEKISKLAARRICDGTIGLQIKEPQLGASIDVKEGKLSLRKELATAPNAIMEFDTIQHARDLFDGADAMTSLGQGFISLRGFIPMIENLNNILGRVAMYLA